MHINRPIILIFLLISSIQIALGTKLSSDKCIPIVKEFENISNITPQEVEARAPKILEQLKEGESLTFYFIVYNIYVENLFNKGKIEKASEELNVMINEALQQEDAECRTIALRTQGQFYYKLGLYERAAESFRKAMDTCPRYDSGELESYFTWSSTLFWLVKSYLETGHINESQQLLEEMEEMMKWLEKEGVVDQIGYKPVMILGLRSRIALHNSDTETARALLDKCTEYIKPDIPSRAYVDYYVGEMMLAVKEGRHADAIPLLDNLIDIHITDYKPIASTFLYQKANSLYELGRYQESAGVFKEYEELQSEIDDISLAYQLDELRTRYDVEKLQHERDQMRNNLVIAIIICIALSVIVTLVVINQKKIKKKNKVLAQNISELHQLSKLKEKEGDSLTKETEAETEAEPNPEYIAIGNTVVEYVKTSKCYLSPNCGRQTIKDAIGVSEQLLSKSLPLVTGMTFVNYINRLRLDTAIELLDNHPEITINKISTMCGFGTMRQFQRIFKHHYDLSPSAYREARAETQKP